MGSGPIAVGVLSRVLPHEPNSAGSRHPDLDVRVNFVARPCEKPRPLAWSSQRLLTWRAGGMLGSGCEGTGNLRLGGTCDLDFRRKVAQTDSGRCSGWCSCVFLFVRLPNSPPRRPRL